MVTPVILPAIGDARNTAVFAMSAIIGISLSMVSLANLTIKSATSGPPDSIASLKGLESGEPAERIFTTRTPEGPSSAARLHDSDSMAQQAGPKPPTIA